MLQKSGRLVLWEAMFILELHSAETQASIYFMFIKSNFLHFYTNFFKGVDCISNFYCHASEKKLHD